MPAEFDAAVKAGGKVITKILKDGKYMHLVKTKGGKWIAGEVKEKKGKNALQRNP